jgi:hypothetical protein
VRRARAFGPLLAVALGLAGCEPRAEIVSPADGSTIDVPGDVAVELDFGVPLLQASRLKLTLLSGIDAAPGGVTDLTSGVLFDVAAAEIGRATIPADALSAGRNTLFLTLDRDGNGVAEATRTSTFRLEVGLRAAACAKTITPVVGENHSDPIYMAGFGNDRQATGVHDDLWARGIVLEGRGVKLALVTLDLIGYFNNEVETIRSLVDPARGFDSITVTSTHNHEGPDALGLWGPSELESGVDLGYLDFVNQSVAECIAEADDALAAAEIRFGTGDTRNTSLPPWPDLVADGEVLQELVVDLTPIGQDLQIPVAGDPGPITNPSVPVLQLRARGGGPVIATLVNYASHPESLDDENTLITSDFPHFMREALETRFGGVAIYMSADLGVLQGPLSVHLADPANPGQELPRPSFAFAERMGEILAERAGMALDTGSTWLTDPEIEVLGDGPFDVSVENPFFDALGKQGVFGRRPFQGGRPGRPGKIWSEVQALRIGPAQIAVTPNELDPQIGDLYRARMSGAEHRFLAGLGNDEIGYQMPEEKFNPTCFLCFIQVLGGAPESCPLNATLDCGTVFINNVGPSADPLLRSRLEPLIDGLND